MALAQLSAVCWKGGNFCGFGVTSADDLGTSTISGLRASLALSSTLTVEPANGPGSDAGRRGSLVEWVDGVPSEADLGGLDGTSLLMYRGGAAVKALAGLPYFALSLAGYAPSFLTGIAHEYGTKLLTMAGLVTLRPPVRMPSRLHLLGLHGLGARKTSDSSVFW